jgi:hypothetical protein
MTASFPRRLGVSLTYRQIHDILTIGMGLEDIDAKSFWRQARRKARNPGCTRRDARDWLARTLAGCERDR